MADAVARGRECTRCRAVKPATSEHFRAVREARNGSPYNYTKRQCKSCEFDQRVEWGRRNRDRQNARRREISGKHRRSNLKKFYGMTVEAYDDLLTKQDNKCAICGVSSGLEYHRSGRNIPLAVDHCHETGTVRGLLCGACDRGLGSFRDQPSNLERAILYLRKQHG